MKNSWIGIGAGIRVLMCAAVVGWGQVSYGQIPDSSLAKQYFELAQQGIISGKIDTAIHYYELAIPVYRRAGMWADYANTANQLGEACIYLNQKKVGLAWLDSAIEVARMHIGPKDPLIADSHGKKGAYYFYQGEYQLGYEQVRQGLDLLLGIPESDRKFLGNTYNAIGFYFQHMGQMDSAIYYYKSAADVWIATNSVEHPNVAIAFNNIGYCYRAKADVDQALTYYERALAIRLNKLGDAHPHLAASYSNIGACYEDEGDYALATEYFLKALAIQLKGLGPDHQNVGTTYTHMGACYGRAGDYPQQLAYLQKALVIRRAALGPDHPRVADVLDRIGNAYGKLGKPGEQLDYAFQAKQIWEKKLGPRHFKVAFALTNIGLSYGEMGRPDGERESLEEGLAILIEHMGEIHPVVAKTHYLLGKHYERNGQEAKALAAFQHALTAYSIGFSPETLTDNPTAQADFALPGAISALAAKARLYARWKTGTGAETTALQFAAATYQVVDSLIRKMRLGLRGVGSRKLLSDTSIPIYESAIEISFRLYELTQTEKHLHQAFEYSERSKALLLQEALQESRARNYIDMPDSVLQVERQLKIDLAFYEKQLFDLYTQKPATQQAQFPILQEQVFNLKETYRQFVRRLEKRYPAYFQLKYDLGNAGVADVQAGLKGKKTQVIQYFWGEENVYLFAISQQEFRVHSLPVQEGVAANIREMLNQLSDAEGVDRNGNGMDQYQAFYTNAYSLFQRLLAPVLDTSLEELVLIPDGPLGYLPFEILIQNAPKHSSGVDYVGLDYLLTAYRIRYAHSAGLISDGTSAGRGKTRELGGFAPDYLNTSKEARWAALAGNQPEVKGIVDLIGGQAFLGKAATERTFKEAAANFGILHLAMHTQIDDENPLYSGLIFSQDSTVPDSLDEDGILHAYEIYTLRLNAELAVLSACETGRGQLARGEGIMSLARAFRFAGCPNIVTSLWQTDDRISRELMHYFYEYLAEGVPKDEALRQAKLQILANSSQQHPHYWAAFVLIGNDQPIQAPDTWKYILLLLIGGAVFFGVLQFLRNRT